MAADIYIAMPVYQGSEYIVETIESIHSQSYADFRVVMSIDGADDPTIELCRSFTSDNRFELRVQPTRLGWPGNFNWLAHNCDLEFFCYWQQDDLASPDYLDELRSALRATPQASISYADVQWFGNRTDRVAMVDIDGTPLQRCLQAAEALHYVPLRGLVRTSKLPRRPDPIPIVPVGQPHQDFVFLAELASAGTFRRAATPLYFKRAHSSSAHHGWSSDPADQRREEWCALGEGLISVAQRTQPSSDEQRLLEVILDRLTIAREGRGFWYLPEQTEGGVSAFVREFFSRYPHRLPDVDRIETDHMTGFERPVHWWVHSSIAALQNVYSMLDDVANNPSPSIEIHFGSAAPAVWMLGRGWSTPEPWGTWTDAEVAELILPPHTFTCATVTGHPFAHHGPVRLAVSVGDGDLIEQRCVGTTSFTVDLDADDGSRQRVIRLHAPDAVSPLDAGVSSDSRRLGFALCSLTLER